MRTGSLAPAARNAALSAMLRMLPPETLSRASFSGSRCSVGAAIGKMRLQICVALHRAGKRKLSHKADAPQERWVKRLLHIRREDRESAIGLHALQQVADFDVRVAVVAVSDFAALAEERVGLIEKQNRTATPLPRQRRAAGSSPSLRCIC